MNVYSCHDGMATANANKPCKIERHNLPGNLSSNKKTITNSILQNIQREGLLAFAGTQSLEAIAVLYGVPF